MKIEIRPQVTGATISLYLSLDSPRPLERLFASLCSGPFVAIIPTALGLTTVANRKKSAKNLAVLRIAATGSALSNLTRKFENYLVFFHLYKTT